MHQIEDFIYSESTSGICVDVVPKFIPERSLPEANYYFYAYTVRITNQKDKILQLLNRHWIIRDGQGQEEHVEGEGVVGQRPTLGPNESFQYTSFCPLRTPTGNMRGTYELTDPEGQLQFINIPLFFLRPPQTFH